MTATLQNVRYALRQLAKNPGFTAVAVITLALGIGATTAIYSIVYATFLAPLPYPHADQLVFVWSKINGERNVASAEDFLDWKRQNTVFQDIEAFNGGTFNLATADHPEPIHGQMTTPGWFAMQGFRFFLGRDFLPEEGVPGKDHTVVLTNQLWQRLGADLNIVGKTIRINSEPYTVVGVLVPGVADRLTFELAVPLAFSPDQLSRNFHWLLVLGRMKPGVSISQAQAEMTVITGHIAQDHPDTNKSWGASVEPFRNDFLSKETVKNYWLLLAAVCFVLLIACVNVANLLLARATSRHKEVAVRASLGARPLELFAQFLIESLVLAALSGILGIGLAEAVIRGVMAIIPPFIVTSEADIRISVPILLFTLLITVLAAVAFGVLPAWRAAHSDPNEALKEGGRAGTGSGAHSLRRSLVVVEFSLALTLLTAAGLAIHSFWNLSHEDLGVRRDHILTFYLPVPQGRIVEPERMIAFYRQLIEKLESFPGVSHAEAATGRPVEGAWFGKSFSIVGQPVPDLSARPDTAFQMVTPEYFETFGIRVVKGRSFTEQDTATSPPVAMVNETFVRRYLAGTDPLSQRVAVDQPIPGVARNAPPVERQIVGVFHDVRHGGSHDEESPEVDIPFWQTPWPRAEIAVRTSSDPGAATSGIAETVLSVDPDLPLANVRTMDQVVTDSRISDRFVTVLYSGFAAVALLLAAVGIYGVMAFAVAQRTRELGLRMALGAGRGQVFALILKEGAMLASAGLVLGLLGACLVGRTMHGMLFGVGTIDFAAFAAVAFVLLTSAILACYIPARRAARVDPMVALRYE